MINSEGEVIPFSRYTIIRRRVNKWCNNNNWVKVLNIKQSSTEKETIISIWYNEPDVPILG